MKKFTDNLMVFALVILVSGNGVHYLTALATPSLHRAHNEDQLAITSLAQRLCLLERCRHSLDQLERCLKYRCSSDQVQAPIGKPANLEPKQTGDWTNEDPISEEPLGNTDVNLEGMSCEGCEDATNEDDGIPDCVGDNCSRTNDESALMLSSSAKRSPPMTTATLSCQDACVIIGGDMNVEKCFESYCTSPDKNNGWLLPDTQSSQSASQSGLLGSSKRWGNRAGMRKVAAKRWGSRICMEAHCGTFEGNRNAFVACGQSRCGK